MEKKEKKGYIIILLMIIIPVLIKVLLMPFGDLDEIWVYDLSRGISMGYVPYRDFHIVFTPLFNLLFSIPLLISRRLIVYRLTSAVLFSVMLFLIYKTGAEDVGKGAAVTVVAFSLFMFDVATYNYLMFVFALAVYMVNKREPGKKRNVALGVLVVLAALSRQTSGGILIITESVYLLIENRKKKTGMIRYYFAGMLFPGLVFVIYLLASGSFVQFWDHCLFALIGFGSNNGIIDSGAMGLILIVVIGIVADLFLLYLKKEQRCLSHLLVGISIICIAVPMVDFLHVTMAVMYFSVSILELVHLFLSKYLKDFVGYIVYGFFAAGVIAVSIINVSGCYLSDEHKELVFIPLTGMETGFKGIADKNAELEAEGKNVRVVSSGASLVSILSEDYDPTFDLFLEGNL
ncbi:MAG: hypothetical protein IKT14_02335, partial [Clostridiales bacterium]|nr:hypothetical protein [Clostridiales bacterium]